MEIKRTKCHHSTPEEEQPRTYLRKTYYYKAIVTKKAQYRHKNKTNKPTKQ